MSVSLDDVRAAASRIEGAVERTPCLHSRTLSSVTGAQVYLKFENLQFTASFKERGALNRLLALSEEERERGVIAMSAGNHAQGVAYHAQRLGIPATIVMPRTTPYVKISQTEHFGARVLLEGEVLSEAAEAANGIARQEGLTFVHPYDDDHIIAGQGTIALEMLDSEPGLDVLVVPVGGGGLISGIATAARALKPEIEIIAVEAGLYPALYHALRGEEARCGGTTIAEGIAVKTIGKRPLDICRELVDDVVLVSETHLERAVNLLLTIEKTVAEGAGAAGLAALLAEPARFAGRRVGMPICGGNIDPRLLASVIMRELMRDGRIARLMIDVADSPGQLAHVANIVAGHGCSIVEVAHQRLSLDLTAKHTYLDMMIEARDARHVAQIVDHLRGEGYLVRNP
ncbi:MAG: threonine ammonia-lyase [Alphaproteobacteria bacterium]